MLAVDVCLSHSGSFTMPRDGPLGSGRVHTHHAGCGHAHHHHHHQQQPASSPDIRLEKPANDVANVEDFPVQDDDQDSMGLVVFLLAGMVLLLAVLSPRFFVPIAEPVVEATPPPAPVIPPPPTFQQLASELIALPALQEMVAHHIQQHSEIHLTEPQLEQLVRVLAGVDPSNSVNKELFRSWFDEYASSEGDSVFHRVDTALAASKTVLLSKVEQEAAGFRARIAAIAAQVENVEQLLLDTTLSPGLKEQVDDITDDKIAVYHADQTNRIDYAAHYSGGDVIYSSLNNLLKDSDHFFASLFDSFLPTKPPQAMLRGSVTPGNCWPIHGDKGWAVVKLRDSIDISSVSIEHVPFTITPSTGSAPKHVRVWGLDGSEHPLGASPDGFHKIGQPICELVYSLSGKPLQEIQCTRQSRAFKFVGLEILSNHGANYTCIYRFRVHGEKPQH